MGIPPFYHKNQHIMYQYIQTKDVIFPDPKKYDIKVSPEAKDIIVKLLKKKPSERLGLTSDIEEIMAHPFFSSVKVEKLLKKELPAPFLPPLKPEDKYDLQNFEIGGAGAKEMGAMESVDDGAMAVIKKHEGDFRDFSKALFLGLPVRVPANIASRP